MNNKNTPTPTPHDAVFKQFLGRPETARDFIELHLPPDLRELCKLDTLQLEPGSFLEDNLRPYYSDVLYRLETTSGDGYIQVLIEHQSTPDKHIAFRLMRYAIAAMQRHLEAGNNTLPLVIPILFYAGRTSPHPYPTNWLELFSDPETARSLYGNAFPLVDVTVIPDDEIMHHRSMAALTLVQKHIRQRDLAELLEQLVTLLLSNHNSEQQLKSLIHYMVQAGESRQTGAGFIQELARRLPQHEDNLMTIAQELEHRGLEKGRVEGLEKGRVEEKVKIARAMLEKGLERGTIMEMTGLSESELNRICR